MHGYEVPEAIDEAGLRDQFDDAMERSAALYDALLDPFPEQAPYAVSLAYRIRFAMQMNAREAMHLLELRTAPSGHPPTARSRRRCTASSPSRPATAPSPPRCRYVDHTTYELERLAAERAAEARRAAGAVVMTGSLSPAAKKFSAL